MARKNADLVTGTDIQAEASELSPDELNARDEAEEASTPVSSAPIAMTFEQIMQLVSAAKSNGLTAADLASVIAHATAKGMEAGAERVKPKELKQIETERKSAFNPLGEKQHPRPKLKCHMYFGSAPIGSPKEVTTLTREEILALNELTPGHYRIRKLDGSQRIIEVKGSMNSNRQLDRLWILLPEGDDQQNLYPALVTLAQQCTETNRVTPEMVA